MTRLPSLLPTDSIESVTGEGATPVPICVETGDVNAYDILTLAQAASFLRINRKTLLEALARRKIPGKRVGRVWRLSRTALLEWLGASTRPDGKQ